MTTVISVKDSEVMLLFIANLKSMFLKKLKKMNVDIKFTLNENQWLNSLFYGDLKTKTLALPMGKEYEFEMILCACSNGTVVMEMIFEKTFEDEMKAKNMKLDLVKRVGTANCKEEIFSRMTQSFYLEDLVIVNTQNNEKMKQMFGKDGELSWELTGLSWELNISGIGIQAVTTAQNTVVPTQTVVTMPRPLGTMTGQTTQSPPPTHSLGGPAHTPVPTLINATARASGTAGRSQPPILGRIQESLQTKTPSFQSVQYLTTSSNFNVPPPRFPSSSTPKKKPKNKTKRKLTRITPLPLETDTETNDDERHQYETLGGESSVSEVQERRETPKPGGTIITETVRMNETEYVPASEVANLITEAINKLLEQGAIVRCEKETESESSTSPEKTMVSINNEPNEEIQDIINLPSILEKQPAKEAKENDNDKSTNEKGEHGPETRSKSRAKGPEEN